MYYFKDSGDGFYALADLSIKVPESYVSITSEEALALQTAPPVHTYQELRAAAYPPIGDQLDAMWKGLASSGIALGADGENMLNAIKEVKISYPKNG